MHMYVYVLMPYHRGKKVLDNDVVCQGHDTVCCLWRCMMYMYICYLGWGKTRPWEM